MTTFSSYEHHYQFPPQSLEFHYRLWTRIHTKLRRVRLWFYRTQRRSLFSSIATSPALPAIPVTPKPSVPPNLTATIWPITGGQITQPLSRQPSTPPNPQMRERVTQPLVLTVKGDFNRAWTQADRSGVHPSVQDCTEAALDTLAKQRPFPEMPAWHPAHPEATLRRIRVVKPFFSMRMISPMPEEPFPEHDWIQ